MSEIPPPRFNPTPNNRARAERDGLTLLCPTTRRRLERAKAQLEADGPVLSVRAVAQNVGWGEEHLRRLFQVAFGRTPREIQRQAQLKLLINTRRPIHHIARICGFTPSHFSQRFQREYGCTPREFRALALLEKVESSS